ncbi:MAG: glycosyltransferase family 4 protein [Methanomassiliicoccales archaeon]|nr:glycosyltransferase family 4 protein [Methanomassiliicoccales archaeon]
MTGQRVLMLLTNEYRPDPRVRKEALALKEGGFEPSIVAWDRNLARPATEVVEGVRLLRVRTGNVGGPRSLILNYPLFALRAFRQAMRQGFDVVHANDLDTLLLGRLLAWLKNVPLIFDAHEQYARMIRVDVSERTARLFDRLERSLLPKVDLAITVNGKIADNMSKWSRERPLVIMNAVDVPEFRAKNANRQNGEIVLYYGGTLEPMRYIEETVKAVADIEGIRLVIAGNGRLEGFCEKAAREHGNIEFHGFLPHQTMMGEMSEADVVLCLIDPSNLNYVDSLPNKVCEAMALGMPVLTSKRTYSAEVVERLGVGLAIEWSESDLLKALSTLRDEGLRRKMGGAGRKLAEERYNWSRMEERLLSGYRSILRR